MGTSNFYPHENGIFVIEGATEEYAKESIIESLKDMYTDEEELQEEINSITDEEVYYEMNIMDEMLIEGYMDMLIDDLPYGMTGNADSMTEATIFNKQGKVIARLEIRSGYYADAQVIVETDPEEIVEGYEYMDTNEELYEVYSPHHKRLLKHVSKMTQPIIKLGGFSDGTAVYEKA